MTYVLAKFDWAESRLNLRMVRSTRIYGAIVNDPRQWTLDPAGACRWQSRQAARQALRRLRSRLILGDGWDVVNLERFAAVQ